MYASMIKNKKIIRDYLDKLADIDNTPFVDVTKKSFRQFREACKGYLTWTESKELYNAIKGFTQQMEACHRQVSVHANP
ncbi:hypothetical protein, partial [Zooshikella sp. RANM57]|uniref:hypothetical protein n=1 Tax=Zooshikella sp. RANM57 TaxID=3425863 RepID=UPI003D6FA8D1